MRFLILTLLVAPLYADGETAPTSCLGDWDLISDRCYSEVYKAARYGTGATCEPIKDHCASMGAEVATREEMEAWLEAGERTSYRHIVTSTYQIEVVNGADQEQVWFAAGRKNWTPNGWTPNIGWLMKCQQADKGFVCVNSIGETTPHPSKAPTRSPTAFPTAAPTKQPTRAPTDHPSTSPTPAPSRSPTRSPTSAPSEQPTRAPTDSPTKVPTRAPTDGPTKAPTDSPTRTPTSAPTEVPTRAPTNHPSVCPTAFPSGSPTRAPTQFPSRMPTVSPTFKPLEAYAGPCSDLRRMDCIYRNYKTCVWVEDAFCDNKADPEHSAPYMCSLFLQKHQCNKQPNCMFDDALDHGDNCIDYVEPPSTSPSNPPSSPPTPAPTNPTCHLITSKSKCDDFNDVCEYLHNSFCDSISDPEYPGPMGNYPCNLFSKSHQCKENGCTFDVNRPFHDRCIDFVARPTNKPTKAPTRSPTRGPTDVDCLPLNRFDCKKYPGKCLFMENSFCDDVEAPLLHNCRTVSFDGKDHYICDPTMKAMMMPPLDFCGLFWKEDQCEKYGCTFDRFATGQKCIEYIVPEFVDTEEPTPTPSKSPVEFVCLGLNKFSCAKYANEGCVYRMNSFCDKTSDPLPKEDWGGYPCNLFSRSHECKQNGCIFKRKHKPVKDRCQRAPAPETPNPTESPTAAPTATPPPLECEKKGKAGCTEDRFGGLCRWVEDSFCEEVANPITERNKHGGYPCNMFRKAYWCTKNICTWDVDRSWEDHKCIDLVEVALPDPTEEPTQQPTEAPTNPVCLDLNRADCAKYSEHCEMRMDSFCDDKANPLAEPYPCNLFHKESQCKTYLFEGERACSFDIKRVNKERCFDYVAPITNRPSAPPTPSPTEDPTAHTCLDYNWEQCRHATDSCTWKLNSYCDDNVNPVAVTCDLFKFERQCETNGCTFDYTKDFGERCIDFVPPPTRPPTSPPTPKPTAEPTEPTCLALNAKDCRKLDVFCTWTLDAFCNDNLNPEPQPYRCDLFKRKQRCLLQGCTFLEDNDFGEQCVEFIPPITKDPTEAPTPTPSSAPTRVTCYGLNNRDCRKKFSDTCEWKLKSFCDDRDFPMAEPYPCEAFNDKPINCDKYFFGDVGCRFNKEDKVCEQTIAPTEEPTAVPTAFQSPNPTRQPTLLPCKGLNKKTCRKERFNNACVWTADTFCDDLFDPEPQPYDCTIFVKGHACRNYAFADDAEFYGCDWDKDQPHGSRCSNSPKPETPAPTQDPTKFPTAAPTNVLCLGKSKRNCRKSIYAGICLWTEDAFCNQVDGGLEAPYACGLFKSRQNCNRQSNCVFNKQLPWGERCIDAPEPETPSPTDEPTANPTSFPTALSCEDKLYKECINTMWAGLCQWTEGSFCEFVEAPRAKPYDCNLFVKNVHCSRQPNCQFDNKLEHGSRCFFKPPETDPPTAEPTASPTKSPTALGCHLKTKNECRQALFTELCDWVEDSWCEDITDPVPKPYSCDLFEKEHPCKNNGCRYDRSLPFGSRCLDNTEKPTAEPTAAPTGNPTRAPTDLVCEGKSKNNCRYNPECVWQMDTWCEHPDNPVATPYPCNLFLKQSQCGKVSNRCRYDWSKDYGERCVDKTAESG